MGLRINEANNDALLRYEEMKDDSPLEINDVQSGQVLRSALSLAVGTGRTLLLRNLRTERDKPGLGREHLACINAAAAIANAETEGAFLSSEALAIRSDGVQAGDYTFKMGTASSCLLLLQTILPPLLRADGPSTIALEGVTHASGGPPFELIDRAYLPALRAMGIDISARMERRGFIPAGGGRVVVELLPGPDKNFRAMERGMIKRCYAEAMIANLPIDIAKRELDTVGARLELDETDLLMREVRSDGPGNALIITMEHDLGAEVIAEFGVHGRSAEKVAKTAVREAEVFMAGHAAIGRHLADQLMVPMALRSGGNFTTVRPSRHSVATADVIRMFKPGAVEIRRLGNTGHRYEVEIHPIARAEKAP